ncbi:MAG: hypothetical protein Q4F80_05990 [bacterium]|nr:hypothetical protein [bacterium]
MGMAASQARFLSLTARKSNVEYEGQQINQERTALANESSNLYAQLTKLEVPSPPSTSDFYKTVYSFKSNQLSADNSYITYSLDNIQSTPDGDVAILSHDVTLYQNLATPITGSVSRDTNPSYPAGTVTTVSDTNSTTSSAPYNVKDGLLSGKLFNSGDSTYAIYLEEVSTHQSTLDVLTKDNGVASDYVSTYDFDGDGEGTQYLSYAMIGGTKYYLTNNQMSDESGSFPSISALATVQSVSKTVTEEFAVSRYEVNDTGRTTSVTVKAPAYNSDGSVQVDENGQTIYKDCTYELECTSVQDEDAYQQAMLDYEYYQSKYEKQVSDINAKTEAIQQKDKTLELELKQLDTEQNAISTEMDAVTKVVEDNVESTFKTFA